MSIQAGDFRLSFERVSASESIRRVERESPMRDFGKKNREHKKDEDAQDPEFETPQDVVEVAGHDSKDSLPKITTDASQVISLHQGISAALIPEPSDRHIDIKV